MSEYLSATQAIKRAQDSLRCRCSKIYTQNGRHGPNCDDDLVDELEAVLSLILSIKPTQWQDISTAPIETRFLALDESGYVTPVTKGSGADYDWWRDDDNACESEFTHWMHLPQPPKAKP